MDLGIKDKVALITGGARGLGKKTALILAEEGVNIAVFDIVVEGELGAGVTVSEVEKLGRKARAYKVDITKADAVKEAVKKVNEELGAAEILINCAATVDHMAKVLQQSPELWNRDMSVNLTGQFHMVQAVIPGMLEKGWGRIINFSSVAGTLGGFGQLSYSVTKAGMVGFTKTIALEFARKGITCNCIVPGLAETEMVRFMPEENKQRITARTAYRKLGETEDIAYAIAFLVSQRAKYITGDTIYVDGGIQLFTF